MIDISTIVDISRYAIVAAIRLAIGSICSIFRRKNEKMRKIYNELYECFYNMDINVEKLYPVTERVPISRNLAIEQLKHRYSKACEATNIARRVLDKYKPFIEKEMFDILWGFIILCNRQLTEIKLRIKLMSSDRTDNNDQCTMDEIYRRTFEIQEKFDDIGKRIKKYVV